MPDIKSHSQSFIMDPMEQMGLIDQKSFNGVCIGFTQTWIHAYLVDEEKNCMDRIQFIRDNPNLAQQIKSFEEKYSEQVKKANEQKLTTQTRQKLLTLTKEAQQLVDARAFLETIRLCHRPYDKPQFLLNRSLSTAHEKEISDVVAPLALQAKKGLAEVYRDEILYDKNEWADYLEALREIIKDEEKKSQGKIAVSIMGAGHRVGLRLNSTQDKWVMIDLNNPTLCPVENIADELIAALDSNEEFTGGMINIFTTGDNKRHAEIKQRLSQFKNTRKVPLVEMLTRVGPGNMGIEHLAATNNDADKIQQLVECKADLNNPALNGNTPAIIAAERNCIESLRLLAIDKKLLESTNFRGFSPVHAASETNQADALELLIKANADMNATAKGGWTPVHVAVEKNSLNAMYVLCNPAHKKKIDLNKTLPNGWNAVHLAVQDGRSEILKLLINAGADIVKSDYKGLQPIHRAASLGSIQAISILIQAKVNPVSQDSLGHTPLYYAIKNKQWSAAALLLIRIPDIKGLTKEDKTAVEFYRSEILNAYTQFFISNSLSKQTLTEASFNTIHHKNALGQSLYAQKNANPKTNPAGFFHHMPAFKPSNLNPLSYSKNAHSG